MQVQSPTQQVTQGNFAEIVGEGIVVLDFWAAWCGPCRAFSPIFEAAARKHQDIVFGKVDTDAESALSAAFRIRSIPTLIVIRDGVVLAEQHGLMPASALDELIGRVREVDMDEVRRQIDEADAAGGERAPQGGV